MTEESLSASLESVRRLTVTKQHLAGKRPSPARSSAILSVVRDLGYVQWDPVSIVAPSHLISLWSRVPGFRSTDLDRLLWDEKKLFLHWTPMASIVLTEDYPLYRSLMTRYPESLTTSWGNHRKRAKEFLAQHGKLRKKLLGELRKGPLLMSQLEEHAPTKRGEGGWEAGSDPALMMFHLLMSGQAMVVGHRGRQNLWGLSEEFLPRGVDRKGLSESAFEREAAQRSLRALGTATPREITYYFVRGRYQNLRKTLAQLHEESAIHRVHVEGGNSREERWIHELDVPLLESMGTAAWEPRMSLLPPFDNLIGSTDRTRRLFGFDYVREQFLPAEKRRYGTYVLPILWGERLIGRIDPRLDRARGELVINAVHAEPDAPGDREVGAQLSETIARFAAFLGASRVTYTSRVPRAWRTALG